MAGALIRALLLIEGFPVTWGNLFLCAGENLMETR
jgi:hypothetical protein